MKCQKTLGEKIDGLEKKFKKTAKNKRTGEICWSGGIVERVRRKQRWNCENFGRICGKSEYSTTVRNIMRISRVPRNNWRRCIKRNWPKKFRILRWMDLWRRLWVQKWWRTKTAGKWRWGRQIINCLRTGEWTKRYVQGRTERWIHRKNVSGSIIGIGKIGRKIATEARIAHHWNWTGIWSCQNGGGIPTISGCIRGSSNDREGRVWNGRSLNREWEFDERHR